MKRTSLTLSLTLFGACAYAQLPHASDLNPSPHAYSEELELSCPLDVYSHFDLLALQAKEGGLAFIQENPTIETGRIGVDGAGESSHINFGMRLGGGIFFSQDAWSLDANWTWINILQHRKIHPLPTIASGTTAQWEAHYNVFDMKLGRPYQVSKWLILTPHFGLRGGWIHQLIAMHSSAPLGGTSRNRMDFWGGGARAGIEGDGSLYRGWFLFSHVSTSLLLGSFAIDSDGEMQGAKQHFAQSVPNLEAGIGVGWNRYFQKNQYAFNIRMAYEFIKWWDQNNLWRFTLPEATPGNLKLYGLSLRLQLDL